MYDITILMSLSFYSILMWVHLLSPRLLRGAASARLPAGKTGMRADGEGPYSLIL